MISPVGFSSLETSSDREPLQNLCTFLPDACTYADLTRTLQLGIFSLFSAFPSSFFGPACRLPSPYLTHPKTDATSLNHWMVCVTERLPSCYVEWVDKSLLTYAEFVIKSSCQQRMKFEYAAALSRITCPCICTNSNRINLFCKITQLYCYLYISLLETFMVNNNAIETV